MTDQCDRCDEEHDVLRETTDGGLICPQCIRREAARHQAKEEERRRRREVTRERGWWVVKR